MISDGSDTRASEKETTTKNYNEFDELLYLLRLRGKQPQRTTTLSGLDTHILLFATSA